MNELIKIAITIIPIGVIVFFAWIGYQINYLYRKQKGDEQC